MNALSIVAVEEGWGTVINPISTPQQSHSCTTASASAIAAGVHGVVARRWLAADGTMAGRAQPISVSKSKNARIALCRGIMPSNGSGIVA